MLALPTTSESLEESGTQQQMPQTSWSSLCCFDLATKSFFNFRLLSFPGCGLVHRCLPQVDENNKACGLYKQKRAMFICI